MTERERADEAAYYGGGNGESFDYRTSGEHLATLPIPEPSPFRLLISAVAQCASPDDVCGRTYSAYEEIMGQIEAAWPGGELIQVESGHDIYRDDLEAVRAEIDDVLALAAG